MNNIIFLLLYLFFMIITYFVRISGLAMMFDEGTNMPPEEAALFVGVMLTILYLIMIFLAFLRGRSNGRNYIATFPFIGAVFDILLPFIPFIPTVMNIITLVMGMLGAEKKVIIIEHQGSETIVKEVDSKTNVVAKVSSKKPEAIKTQQSKSVFSLGDVIKILLIIILSGVILIAVIAQFVDDEEAKTSPVFNSVNTETKNNICDKSAKVIAQFQENKEDLNGVLKLYKDTMKNLSTEFENPMYEDLPMVDIRNLNYVLSQFGGVDLLEDVSVSEMSKEQFDYVHNVILTCQKPFSSEDLEIVKSSQRAVAYLKNLFKE